MVRTSVNIPDDLAELARQEGMNVSELTRDAIATEAQRLARRRSLYDWLDELDKEHPPTASQRARARAKVEAARSTPPVRKARKR
jgi:post-segregation antitoxin (ccd killing protein)